MAPKNVYLPPNSQIVALDCEYVGGAKSKDTPDRGKDLPARVSIVDGDGRVLCDEYIKPTEPIVDYRTAISGIREKHLKNASPIETVREKVVNLIAGKYLVGHEVEKDLKVIGVPMIPKMQIRDTSIYRGLRNGVRCNFRKPKLSVLAEIHLGKKIHGGAPHDSVEDARIAMEIYKKFRTMWERNVDRYLETYDEPNFESGSARCDDDFGCDYGDDYDDFGFGVF